MSQSIMNRRMKSTLLSYVAKAWCPKPGTFRPRSSSVLAVETNAGSSITIFRNALGSPGL